MNRKRIRRVIGGGLVTALSAIVLFAAAPNPAAAQMSSGGGGLLQAKVTALKQSAAENKQRLQQYQWIETRQITLKGNTKPQQSFQCSYGANGQVEKVPMDNQQQQQPQQQGGRRGGRVKERVVEKKTEEMKDYMQQVQGLLAMYMPPNPDKMQAAMQGGNISIQRDGGDGTTDLVFKDYAKPGDKMTIGFDTGSKKISTIKVNTYMDEPKDTVTLAVQMASLPDGTNYSKQTVLNATAKQIQVTTNNSNYVKIR